MNSHPSSVSSGANSGGGGTGGGGISFTLPIIPTRSLRHIPERNRDAEPDTDHLKSHPRPIPYRLRGVSLERDLNILHDAGYPRSITNGREGTRGLDQGVRQGLSRTLDGKGDRANTAVKKSSIETG